MESNRAEVSAELSAARQRRLSLRRAMGNLEAALAAPAAGRVPEWFPAVRAAVTDLTGTMRSHVADTEGPGGFHREMVTTAPRLAHEVELAVAEHRRIAELSQELVTMLDDAGENWSLVERSRQHGTTLLGVLARHRQRGADMIFEAYESDLGGED